MKMVLRGKLPGVQKSPSATLYLLHHFLRRASWTREKRSQRTAYLDAVFNPQVGSVESATARVVDQHVAFVSACPVCMQSLPHPVH